MAEWKKLLGGAGGDKTPDGPKSPADIAQNRPKGMMARTLELSEANKEVIGLLQQFAVKELDRLNARNPEKYMKSSLEDFAVVEIKSPHETRILIRVPGREEAKAIQNVLRKANGIAEETPNPLKKKQRSTKRTNFRTGEERETYFVYFNILEHTPEKCKNLLEASLHAIRIEPDWKSYYSAPTYKDEAEFRRTLRKLEDDTPDDLPPGAKQRQSL